MCDNDAFIAQKVEQIGDEDLRRALASKMNQSGMMCQALAKLELAAVAESQAKEREAASVPQERGELGLEDATVKQADELAAAAAELQAKEHEERADDNADDNDWYYLDTVVSGRYTGIEWGPFSKETLTEWFRKGIIPENLMVRHRNWTAHVPAGVIFRDATP